MAPRQWRALLPRPMPVVRLFLPRVLPVPLMLLRQKRKRLKARFSFRALPTPASPRRYPLIGCRHGPPPQPKERQAGGWAEGARSQGEAPEKKRL